MPQGIPPIVGTAMIENSGRLNGVREWQIRLTVPKVSWRIEGEVLPKRSWPKLKTEVQEQTLLLRMDGPRALSPSYVMERDGHVLDREEIMVKLQRETPVLVSVSGKIPDPYYLQLTQPDALIVILGAREKAPRPELLPYKKIEGTNH